jgi:hypothetical protein
MRYGFEDIVAYALKVAEEMDPHDPPTRKLLLVLNMSNGLLPWEMKLSHPRRIRLGVS